MGFRRSISNGSAVVPPARLAAVRRSLEVIAYRAIRTGRGPDLVVASITRRADAPGGGPSKQWRFAQAIAAELAPDVCRRMTARAESVVDSGDTAVW